MFPPRALMAALVVLGAVLGSAGAAQARIVEDPQTAEPAPAVEPAPAAPMTVTATPRAATPGSPVEVAGDGCASTVTVSLLGSSDGWEDPQATYSGATTTGDADGRWTTTVVMPPEAVSARVRCTTDDGETLVRGGALIAALGGPSRSLRLEEVADGTRVVLDLDPIIGFATWWAGTAADGTAVPLEEVETNVLLAPPGTEELVVVAYVVHAGEFGGSLEADGSVEQFALPAPVDEPAPVEEPAPADVTSGPSLPDTGTGPALPLTLAACLVALGAALLGLARRAAPSGHG